MIPVFYQIKTQVSILHHHRPEKKKNKYCENTILSSTHSHQRSQAVVDMGNMWRNILSNRISTIKIMIDNKLPQKIYEWMPKGWRKWGRQN